MFATMESGRVEELHLVSDPSTGLRAIIAIHNTSLGPALGGCRCLAYADELSAARDAVRLARGMSYKAALAGLALGGGKAVVLCPPQLASRAALFEAFGRFVDKLGGRYITAVDSGTLLTAPCDILAPCGLGGVINAQTVGQLRCAAVAGAANNQLDSLEMGDALAARGILYAPDYVINSGGLIFVALQHQGLSAAEIAAHLARIGARLTEIYTEALAEQRSPARVADSLAERLIYAD